MDMKNVKEVLKDYQLKQAKTCGACQEVHFNVQTAYLATDKLIYFDCRCGNTLAHAPNRPENR